MASVAPRDSQDLAGGASSSSAPRLLWPEAPGVVSLEPGEVHVWAIPLAPAPGSLEAFNAVLAPEERLRAARFRFDLHRNRFVIGRARLRGILGRYLQAAPARIEFGYARHGKPFLTGNFSEAELEFNFSHSVDLALLALTREKPIGVDVERIRPLVDAGALVARFFSPNEDSAFRGLAERRKREAFFNLWTRKEAWLKATGEGIGHALNKVEVSFLPEQPPAFFSLPGVNECAPSSWRLKSFAPAQGFTAALATTAAAEPLRCWRWPEGVDPAL